MHLNKELATRKVIQLLLHRSEKGGRQKGLVKANIRQNPTAEKGALALAPKPSSHARVYLKTETPLRLIAPV